MYVGREDGIVAHRAPDKHNHLVRIDSIGGDDAENEILRDASQRNRIFVLADQTKQGQLRLAILPPPLSIHLAFDFGFLWLYSLFDNRPEIAVPHRLLLRTFAEVDDEAWRLQHGQSTDVSASVEWANWKLW